MSGQGAPRIVLPRLLCPACACPACPVPVRCLLSWSQREGGGALAICGRCRHGEVYLSGDVVNLRIAHWEAMQGPARRPARAWDRDRDRDDGGVT